MYIFDHKPALAMTMSSVLGAAVNSAPTVKVLIAQPTMFELVEKWVHLVGAVGAACAGFASATWYIYSFMKARKQK